MKIDGSTVQDVRLNKINLLYLSLAIRGVARAIDDASEGADKTGIIAELSCAATVLADINAVIMGRIVDPGYFTVTATEREARNEH